MKTNEKNKKRISENGAREKNAVMLSTAYFKVPNNTSIGKKQELITSYLDTDTGKAERG